MQVHVTTKNDILVLSFEGSLDTGTATFAEAEINKHINAHSKVIFNLDQTKFVSSAGLRVFLATAKKMLGLGGSLKICNANEVVTEILDMSGFSSIMDVQPDLDAAMAAFA